MLLLSIALHEILLLQLDSNTNRYIQKLFTYYPVSPRPILPSQIEANTGDRATIDTIKLQVDNYDLFSIFNGIHTLGYHLFLPNHFGTDWWNWNANYHQRGKKWEKPASITMKLANGETLNKVPLGIRINGNTSRAFPQKSFRLCFRDKYGTSEIPSPFNNDSSSTYHTLVLRNHGANWGNLCSIDALVHSSLPRRDIVLLSRPVVLLLNNEFWGVYHLRSKKKLNHQEKQLGMKIIKPSTKDYAAFCAQLDTLLNCSNDSILYCSTDSFLDINSLQYMIFAQVFFGNKDWPFDNVLIETGPNIRPKFVIKDLDLAFTKPIPNAGFSESYRSYQNVFVRLHNRLLEHPAYNRDFKNVVSDYFDAHCFEKSLKQSRSHVQPFAAHQAARWDRYSVEEFNSYFVSVADSFQMRKRKYLEYLGRI